MQHDLALINSRKCNSKITYSKLQGLGPDEGHFLPSWTKYYNKRYVNATTLPSTKLQKAWVSQCGAAGK